MKTFKHFNLMKKYLRLALMVSAVALLGFQIAPPEGQLFSSNTQLAKFEIKKEGTVLICISSSAYAFHSHVCSGLKRCTHEVKEVTRAIAVDKGYVPCKICY